MRPGRLVIACLLGALGVGLIYRSRRGDVATAPSAATSASAAPSARVPATPQPLPGVAPR